MVDYQPKEKDPRGGSRRGAGRPKGSRSHRTIMKEEIAKQLAIKDQIADDIRMMLPMGVRKTGVKAIEDISIQEIEKEFQKRVGFSAHKLLNAQMSIALGTQSLYRVNIGVDDRGKEKRTHSLVTDQEEIRQYLDDPTMINGSDYFYITTKAPDNNAINSVLDRLLGKASTKIVGPNNADGSEGPIKVIVANFSTGKIMEPQATQPIVESVIQDVIEEENGNQDTP